MPSIVPKLSTPTARLSIQAAAMSEPTTCAAAPFDHAKADIILRTSDNVEFRVFKLFLSLASPFFESLFDIPQPAEASEEQEIKDGLPVIPVTEDSKTLDALLRFCYPCTLADDPKLEVFKDVIDVLDAAKKYSLDAIEQKVRQAISNPKILEAEPLSCFAIAHRGHLREETLLAAKVTLTQPLVPSWFEEIGLISAADLLALLVYHKKCGDAASALRTDLSWIRTHYANANGCRWLSGVNSHHGSACGCPRSARSKYKVFDPPLQWWDEFVEKIFTELQDKPCRATIETHAEKTVQLVRARNCQTCSLSISQGMRDFVDLLAGKVEEVISEIELELKF